MRQSNLKRTWKRYKHDWTSLFLYTCKISSIWLHSADRREHTQSITWNYSKQQTLRQQFQCRYNVVNAIVTSSLLLNVHTMQSYTLHMKLNPLITYICSVNILCTDATAMLFRSTVNTRPVCERHVFVNLTHSTSNFSWLRNFWA